MARDLGVGRLIAACQLCKVSEVRRRRCAGGEGLQDCDLAEAERALARFRDPKPLGARRQVPGDARGICAHWCDLGV